MIRLIIKNISSSAIANPKDKSHLLSKDAPTDLICTDESEFRKYVEVLEKLVKKNSIQISLNTEDSPDVESILKVIGSISSVIYTDILKHTSNIGKQTNELGIIQGLEEIMSNLRNLLPDCERKLLRQEELREAFEGTFTNLESILPSQSIGYRIFYREMREYPMYWEETISGYVAESDCRKIKHWLEIINEIYAEYDPIKAFIDPINPDIKQEVGTNKEIREKKMEVKQSKNPSKVFVVHGRNELARRSIFEFLRSIDLNPLEWSEARSLTKKASPYIGEILEKAFEEAQAIIVLLTGDDLARIGTRFLEEGENKEKLTPQARPNVLFEAGMAFGCNPERTILVLIGNIREFSDIAGRHIIRLDDSAEQRQELVSRLKDAGCEIDITNKKDWLSSGKFNDCLVWPDLEDQKNDTHNSKIIQNEVSIDDTLKNILINIANLPDDDIGDYTFSIQFLSNQFQTNPHQLRVHLFRLCDFNYLETIGAGKDIIGYRLTNQGREYLVNNNLI
jgi:predicted nucleotide-binding protein